MRRLDVIALDEALEEDLPVDLELALGRREQPLIGRDQPVEPAERIVAQRRLVLGHEHQPQALARRHRHQRMRLLVEAREALLVRDVAQPAFEIVGPAVIAADEGARAARCRSRPACRDGGRRCGRRGPCRRSRAPRRSACRPLRGRRTSPPRAAPPRDRTASGERRRTRSISACSRSAIAIVRDRLAPDLLAEVGRAVGDMIEDPLRHGLVVHRRFHACRPSPAFCEAYARRSG